MSFLTVLITVFSLVILAVPGFILAKAKILPPIAAAVFSALILYGCQPMLTFMSFQKTGYSGEIAINMLIVAGLAFVIHFIMLGIVTIAVRNKDNDKKKNAVRFASMFSNCGYMGLPFLQTLFTGELQGEVMIYGAVVIAVFNILNWSVGIFMVTGNKKDISVTHALINPPMLALVISLPVFFIAQTPLVNVAVEGSTLDMFLTKLMASFDFLGDMVTPLAMIVIGIRLSQVKIKELFLDKWAYITSMLKLIVMSVVSMLVVAFLPISSVVKYTLFFTLSMPSATSTVLFAERFGGDGRSGSVFVMLSTILSIATIPLMYLVFSGIFGISI